MIKKVDQIQQELFYSAVDKTFLIKILTDISSLLVDMSCLAHIINFKTRPISPQ